MNSKNKRKFRLWDSKTIYTSLEHVTELMTKIEGKCDENTELEDLPMSIIPTAMLYYIAASYEAMYDKLLDESLIHSGNPKFDTSKLH
jgi:hypothetical protein